MKTVTKKDMVKNIAEKHGMKEVDVKIIVNSVFDEIKEVFSKNNRMEIRNFGVFSAIKRKAKVGRNPKNPTVAIKIPRRIVPHFKPGKPLRDSLLK